jgi:tetratricopeptide (TPR) repeat protein
MKAVDTPLRVFCSFAPKDADLWAQLYNHLRPLEREGSLTFWHQRLITAGTDWTTAVDEQLASASIILLLISPAFLASDYQYGVEMQRAMQRHEASDVRVIPIIVRSVDWTHTPFTHLSPLPIDGKPIAEQRYPDIAFTNVAAGLRRVVEELTPTSTNRSHMDTALGVWNVPYRRNPHFTGRDEVLDRLYQHLSPAIHDEPTSMRQAALTQPQAIKGLGGIGKTQIAVEYAYRSREQGHYTHTFWVNAANEEAILTSFVTLAEQLPPFPGKKETDQRKLVAAIKRWLEQCQQRWLLIFDNADDVLLLQNYLPQRGNGSVLLTTRADAVGSLARSIEVETMGFIEGTHLLLHRAQRFEHASDEEINEAGNIVVALDHFPLALDQAGAYIEETKCRFGDYLEAYQNHRKALLARRGKQATNYPDSVATTWSLSFQKVEQQSPAAAELLRLFAYLSPDRIPEELIKDGAAHWSPLLQRAASDLFTFHQMIEELLKFSLVKRRVEEQMLSIHRLVQAVQVDRMEPEEQRQWTQRIVRAVNTVFPRDPKDDITSWPQCLRYLEQAQACDTLIQHYLLTLPEAADLLRRTGIYLREHGSYTLAEPLFLCALSIREQQLGSEHPGTAEVLNDLAMLYYQHGKYEQAEPLYQHALAIYEQQLGLEHPNTATTLNNLATLYWDQGKYAEAEPLYERALAICEQRLGPQHPDTATSLRSLANLYRDQGKFAEAEPLYERALAIYEQQLGPQHPSTATSLNDLALLYQSRGKYTEAEPLFLHALTIREHTLVSTHPELAETLHALAILQQAQGHYDEARSLYERTLIARTQTLGAVHPHTIDTRECLTALLRSMGQTKEVALLDEEQDQCRQIPQTSADENQK